MANAAALLALLPALSAASATRRWSPSAATEIPEANGAPSSVREEDARFASVIVTTGITSWFTSIPSVTPDRWMSGGVSSIVKVPAFSTLLPALSTATTTKRWLPSAETAAPGWNGWSSSLHSTEPRLASLTLYAGDTSTRT
jgi:hypothetical protein